MSSNVASAVVAIAAIKLLPIAAAATVAAYMPQRVGA